MYASPSEVWRNWYFCAAGLPVSTTQVLCGAIMGIGLFEGKGGVNWRTALKVCLQIALAAHGCPPSPPGFVYITQACSVVGGCSGLC
jgi:hypothetical protein